MRIAVRYHSRSGNTEKIARAIASAAGTTAENCRKWMDQPVDLLFIGGGVYAGKLDDILTRYLEDLGPELVKNVAVFSSSAGRKPVLPLFKAILDLNRVRVLKPDFHSKGKFLFLHSQHPDETDMNRAKTFAQKTIRELEDKNENL